MNPQDPLAALHPLREPELIGWWPLAPGWWVLIALLALLLCVAAIVLWRRHQQRAYRRQALAQLSTLQDRYRERRNRASYLQNLNALLKATALRAYPREEVAAISGERWCNWLNSTAGKRADAPQFPTAFASAGYHPDPEHIDTDEVFRCARYWIESHEVNA